MKKLYFGMNMSASTTKICATCQYWQGPQVLQNVSDRSWNKFLLTDENAHGICLKKHKHYNASCSCKEHEYHYSIKPYV